MSSLILHSKALHRSCYIFCAFQAPVKLECSSFGEKTNFNANLPINICRSATVIRSEDVASSEEEADANEVVENSVCLFPQNFIVYENNLDCVVCLPNHFMICFYSQMSAGRGECATSWT